MSKSLVDFNKMIPRKESMVKEPITQADYNPNINYVLENKEKYKFDFNLMGGR